MQIDNLLKNNQINRSSTMSVSSSKYNLNMIIQAKIFTFGGQYENEECYFIISNW